MRNLFTLAALALATFVFVGCDKTVEEKSKTEHNRDGSAEKHVEKTTVDDNGGVTKTETHKETPAGDHD